MLVTYARAKGLVVHVRYFCHTDEMETAKLPPDDNGVMNISGIRAYGKPEVEEYRAEVRHRDRARRDAGLPIQTTFEEQTLKRRRTWGSNVEIKDKKSKIYADVLANKWNKIFQEYYACLCCQQDQDL